MALDPESRALLDTLGMSAPVYESTVRDARRGSAALATRYAAGPDMVERWDEQLGPDGTGPLVRILRPVDHPRGVIVYLHGGGWVVGSIDAHESMARLLAARSDCTVVLVAYRKAPESPFPAALDDAESALAWADRHRPRLAREDAALVIGGDSAGAHLAMGAALRARAHGAPRVDAVLLVYPVVDTDTGRASYLSPDNQLLLSKRSMEWFFDQYAPGDLREHPEISLLRSTDWAGFPPTSLLIAEYDPLHDEGEELALTLATAGVPIALHRLSGQMHGFLPMVGVLAASERAIGLLATDLHRILTPTQETAS